MKTRRMKQLVFTLLAMALLLPVKGMAATASLKIEDFTINANETKEMLIDLENPDMEITLVQFDLRLPQGLSIANGDDDIDIAGRTTWKKHALNMNAQDDGTIRFLLASQKNEIISGTSGAIISIMLTAGSDFKGGDIRLENIKLVAPDANATTIKPADYTYTVTTGVVADDVTLTAKSYTREYGEANPDFDYEVTSGSITSGTPTITCSATKTSPVGTYPIVIREGSVSNSNVNLVNGTLTITKAPLTISAGDYTKEEGEANPTFTPTFSGFKNGETKSVLTKQPTITTTATTSSPAGIYPVTVSGAEAQNYDISYVNGTLTVTKKEDPTPELVTPPANLKTETYYVTGKSKYWDGDEQVWTPSDIFGDVQIGFDNNDVYIQGLCEYFGDAWVKGTRSGNNIVFPTGQYMGTDEGYDCYFVGQNKNTGAIVDVILNYNAQTGEYTLPNNLWILNSADKTSLCYSYYYDLLFSKTFMTVYVEEAGTLSSSISDEVKYQLEGLKVFGQLNSTDFRLLRDMAGSDYMNNETQGKLKKLDMENAEIVTGGKDYLEWGYAGTWHIENNNELGNSVFYGCKKLEEVVLPEGLKSIKRDAFKNCDNLTSVAFNDGLTSLGDGVFSHTKLVNVELPDNLTTMGAAVFYGCQDLVSTTIPKNLQKPLSQTFVDCKNLRSVYSHLLNPEGLFGNTNHTAFDYYDANYNLLFTNATLYVPAGTKNLYEQAEGWKKFSKIVEIDGGQEEEVTVALDNSCKIDNYWYSLDGSYDGMDALIMSASAPMSGQQFDEWKVTLSNCFLAGKLRFTVTGGDSNAVEGSFAFRSEGDFVANEDGTVLQYADGNGLQPIAELNATTGELQLMKNETMKRLINAHPSTPVKDALALPLCVKATYNGKEVEVENGAFTVFVQRSVNAEAANMNVLLGMMPTEGVWVELIDLVKMYDWRSGKYGQFDKTADPYYSANFYYYYGVKSIAITNATTENFRDIVTTNLYASEDTFRPFSSVRSNLSLNYSPTDYTWNDYGVSYGYLSMVNNGMNLPPFTLRVPITVTYEWGTLETTVDINFVNNIPEEKAEADYPPYAFDYVIKDNSGDAVNYTTTYSQFSYYVLTNTLDYMDKSTFEMVYTLETTGDVAAQYDGVGGSPQDEPVGTVTVDEDFNISWTISEEEAVALFNSLGKGEHEVKTYLHFSVASEYKNQGYKDLWICLTLKPNVIIQKEQLKGDVNGDDEVGFGDVAAIQDIIASGGYDTDADVNGDGLVNVADIIVVLKIIGGLDAPHAPAGVEAIDLGLPSGTKWANMNVGAEKPEDYGLYFAWGETEGYIDGHSFDNGNYKWYDSESQTYTKYVTVREFGMTVFGNVDHLSVLLPEDDAATVNWGTDWRMPTAEEFQELIDNCNVENYSYTISETESLTGYKFTSKNNGNYILLPKAGYRNQWGVQDMNWRVSYWSSSVYGEFPSQANYLLGTLGSVRVYETPRCMGFSVRPVKK